MLSLVLDRCGATRRARHTAALLLTSGLIFSACASHESIPVSAPSETLPDVCEALSIECVVDGDLRATVIPAPSGQVTKTALLVEPGGPGTSFSQRLREAVRVRGDLDMSVMVVSEPWESRSHEEDCIRAARRVLDGTDGQMEPACTAGMATSSESYVRAVEAAEKRFGVNVTAATGLSWGATRLEFLWPTRPNLPSLLVAPAPPHGTDRGLIARERVQAIGQGSLQRDVFFARLGASYSRRELRQLSARLAEESVSKDELTRRSYAATYRFGSNGVTPAYFGFVADTCNAYPLEQQGGLSAEAKWLVSLTPCPTPMNQEPLVSHPQRACVVTQKADAVTPPALVKLWTVRHGITTTEYAGTGLHAELPPSFPSTLKDLTEGEIPC